NEKGSNTSNQLNKRGNSSTENSLTEDLESEKEVSKQKARTSQQQTRIDGGENYRRKRAPTSKKEFKCWKCRKGFANESELNIHFQNPCEPIQYKSDQCPKEFSHNWLVNDVPEKETHTSQQQTRIDGQENALRKHVFSTSKKGFKCRNCRKVLTNVSELKIHMQNPCELKHGETNQYKCGEFSEEFSHEWKLKEHLVVHWEVKPFGCEHCDLAFKWEKNLTSHMRKYHESEMEAYLSKQESKKGFKCWKCRKGFTNESELNIHMQNPCEPIHSKPNLGEPNQ
ncbi:Zinc finger protein 626, partial [Araneus ventricosus]